MTITATFRDGPLAGTQVEVDIEKHTWRDRKTGACYVRFTEAQTGQPVTYFVLHHSTRGNDCTTQAQKGQL